MLTLLFIMFLGFTFTDQSESPEVHFVRALGRENPDNYELTPENQQCIDSLNEKLKKWYEEYPCPCCEEHVIEPE